MKKFICWRNEDGSRASIGSDSISPLDARWGPNRILEEARNVAHRKRQVMERPYGYSLESSIRDMPDLNPRVIKL